MRLIEAASELLRERLSPTSMYVENLIAIQRAYINTNHPNFLGGAGAVSTVLNQKGEKDKRIKELEKSKREQIDSRRRSPEFDKKSNLLGGETQEPHAPNGSQVDVNPSNGSMPSLSGPLANSAQSAVAQSMNARDGFLTYFFGSKEQEASKSSAPTESFNPLSRKEYQFSVNQMNKQMGYMVRYGVAMEQKLIVRISIRMTKSRVFPSESKWRLI